MKLTHIFILFFFHVPLNFLCGISAQINILKIIGSDCDL